MPSYTIRIELFNPEIDDYYILKARMESAGFTDTTSSVSGTYYSLPHGEYVFDGHLDLDTVSENVRKIAVSVNKYAKILISQTVGRRWFHLDHV